MYRLQEKCGFNTGRALTVRVKPGFTVTNNHVKDALKALQAKHASLQVCALDLQGQLSFEPYQGTNDVPFCEIDATDWVTDFERIINGLSSFGQELLWKVTRLSDPKDQESLILIFAMHHIIMDGVAMSNLMVEFTGILNDIVTGKQMQEPIDQPLLLPPQEHYLLLNGLVPLRLRCFKALLNLVPEMIVGPIARQVMRLMISRMKPDKATEEHRTILSAFTPEEYPDPKSKTCIEPFTLTQKESMKLIAATKNNQTTVYGVIVSAACLALAEVIEKLAGVSVESFETRPLNKTRTTINLRRYYKGAVSDHYLGGHFVGCAQDVEIDFGVEDKQKLLWETARRHNAEIHRQIEEEEAIPPSFFTGILAPFLGSISFLSFALFMANTQTYFGHEGWRLATDHTYV